MISQRFSTPLYLDVSNRSDHTTEDTAAPLTPAELVGFRELIQTITGVTDTAGMSTSHQTNGAADTRPGPSGEQ